MSKNPRLVVRCQVFEEDSKLLEKLFSEALYKWHLGFVEVDVLRYHVYVAVTPDLAIHVLLVREICVPGPQSAEQ